MRNIQVSLRRTVHELLDGQTEETPAQRLTDQVLALLIVISVTAVVLETVPEIAAQYGDLLFAVELVMVAIFTVEYVLRLWSCVERKGALGQNPVTARASYAVQPLPLIDLISILPFYIGGALGLDLRLMRLFRLLRVLKLTRYSPALNTLASVMKAQSHALAGAAFVMSVLILGAASLMYVVEHHAQPEAFASIPHALWWAAVTLTTVGYGDVVPMTPLGRLMGALIMIMGVAIFALPAAIITAGLAREIGTRDFVVSVTRVAKVPFFSDLDGVTQAELASALVPVTHPERYVVVRRGEEGRNLYFITDGTVEVDLPGGSVRLGPNEFFGELALLDPGGRRKATVTTLSECQFLILSSADFERLADRLPGLRKRVEDVADQRRRLLNADGPSASDV
ncbi:MAG: cyclic nucleotide-gated ion channel [Pseudomonadota bacterium]